jgi:ribose transport system ATP-binding protein
MEVLYMSDHVLEMRGITKKFPGVIALDHVNLYVSEGEVHALLGENGAGKSTLMKILAGAYSKDSGEIELFGGKVEIGTPRNAEMLGISIIYQELNLVGALSVAENIFIGRLKTSGGIHVNWADINRGAERLLHDLEIDIDVHRQVRDLGIAQQQMVEVAKALSKEARVIIMDEPTAPLTNRETENLFRVIRKLKANNVTIIYISHRLEEVKEICDQATIMRDGKTIIEDKVASLSMDDIIRHMVGREIKEKYPRIEKAIKKEEVLRIENLYSGDKVKDICFAVHAGEILGIGGLVGAGRTEMARALFKLDSNTGGKVYVRGKLCSIRNPRDAIAAGIGFLTEDRKTEGLVLKMSVGDNITLASLKNFTRLFHLDHGKEQKTIGDYIGKLAIKTPSAKQLANNISGGNQQKIVLAKWMLSHCDVLIFDEPTRGIDVGAKIEVYNIINYLAKEGKAIIVITSEIPELLGISDRILVMSRGRISGELKREEATQKTVMTLATGIGQTR